MIPLFWHIVKYNLQYSDCAPYLSRLGYLLKAFLASSTAIASLIGVSAMSLFPRLVPSVTNASSMPLVIGYTILVYRVFKGKAKLNEASYEVQDEHTKGTENSEGIEERIVNGHYVIYIT